MTVRYGQVCGRLSVVVLLCRLCARVYEEVQGSHVAMAGSAVQRGPTALVAGVHERHTALQQKKHHTHVAAAAGRMQGICALPVVLANSRGSYNLLRDKAGDLLEEVDALVAVNALPADDVLDKRTSGDINAAQLGPRWQAPVTLRRPLHVGVAFFVAGKLLHNLDAGPDVKLLTLLDETGVGGGRRVAHQKFGRDLHAEHAHVVEAVRVRGDGAGEMEALDGVQLPQHVHPVDCVADVFAVGMCLYVNTIDGIAHHHGCVLPLFDVQVLVHLIVGEDVMPRWEAAAERLVQAHRDCHALEIVYQDLVVVEDGIVDGQGHMLCRLARDALEGVDGPVVERERDGGRKGV